MYTLDLKPAESSRAGPPSWKKADTKGRYPAPRSGHAMALLDGDGKADTARLIMFGGVDGDGDALNDLHVRIFSPAADFVRCLPLPALLARRWRYKRRSHRR